MDDQKKLYILHRVLVRIAKFAVTSFFTEVRVIGGDHVPRKGPMIVYVLCSGHYLVLGARSEW